MFLNTKGTNERIKLNKYYIITSIGRVYLNKKLRYSDDVINRGYEILYQHYPKRNLNIEVGTVFEFEKIIDNLYYLDEYFNLSTKFMKYLIDTKEQYWDRAIKNFKVRLSEEDKYSLLKPVFFRYKNIAKDREKLIKLRDNLSNIQRYKKMVLYNVKYELMNNKLRLLEDFWIDLTEIETVKINDRYECIEFKCISLGNIKRFDKVEIEINNQNGVKIKLII